MRSNESDSAIAATLKNHPKLIGYLFALSIALSQVGAVAASESDVIHGP